MKAIVKHIYNDDSVYFTPVCTSVCMKNSLNTFFSVNGPWYDAIFSWYHSQFLATSTLRLEQHTTQEYNISVLWVKVTSSLIKWETLIR